MWTGHDPGARWKWLEEIEMDNGRGLRHSRLDVSSFSESRIMSVSPYYVHFHSVALH